MRLAQYRAAIPGTTNLPILHASARPAASKGRLIGGGVVIAALAAAAVIAGVVATRNSESPR